MIAVSKSLSHLKTLDITVGQPFCCKHLVQHSDCTTIASTTLRTTQSHFDGVMMLGPRVRAPNKVKTPSSNLSSQSPTLNLDFLAATADLVGSSPGIDPVPLYLPGTMEIDDSLTENSAENTPSIASTPKLPRMSRNRLSPPTALDLHHREGMRIDGLHRELSSTRSFLSQQLALNQKKNWELSECYKEMKDLNSKIQELTRQSAHLYKAKELDIECAPESASIRRTLFLIKKYDALANDPSVTKKIRDSAIKKNRFWTGVATPLEIATAAVGKKKSQANANYTREEWILIYMMHLRLGLSTYNLHLEAEVCETQVQRWLRESEETLFAWAQDQVSLPSVAEWDSMTSEAFKEIYPNSYWFFIDGTYIPIDRPSNGEVQKECWQAKHQTHALVFNILVATNGQIVFVSRLDLGNLHAANAWTACGGPEKLHEQYDSELRTLGDAYEFAICGDLAYRRASIPPSWKVRVAMSAAEHPGEPEEPLEEEPIDEEPDEPNETFLATSEILETMQDEPKDTRKKTRAGKPAKGDTKEPKKTTKPQSKVVAYQEQIEDYATRSVHKALDDEVILDPRCAQFRSVAERTLARVKNFSCLNNRDITSRTISEVQEMVHTICGIVNYDMRKFEESQVEAESNM